MRVWTLIELFRFTRAELVRLHREIFTQLKDLPQDTDEYRIAVVNLQLIRRVLARPSLAPP